MRYLRLDSQILSSFSHCPLRCNFRFNERLTKPEEVKAFAMGSIVHAGLESYYNDLIAHVPYKERHEKAIVTANTYGTTETEQPTENIELCLRTINDYLTFRREDRILVHSVEKPFSKVLYIGPDRTGEPITLIYEGKIDLIASSEEKEIIDHKTTSKIGNPPVDMRLQFIGYTWATGLRVVHNRIGFQERMTPSERFKRFTFKYHEALVVDWEKFAIRKGLQYAQCLDTGEWPQNFGECEGSYGYACDFADICRFPTLAEDTKKMFKIGEPWDVYKEKNT